MQWIPFLAVPMHLRGIGGGYVVAYKEETKKRLLMMRAVKHEN